MLPLGNGISRSTSRSRCGFSELKSVTSPLRMTTSDGWKVSRIVNPYMAAHLVFLATQPSSGIEGHDHRLPRKVLLEEITAPFRQELVDRRHGSGPKVGVDRYRVVMGIFDHDVATGADHRGIHPQRRIGPQAVQGAKRPLDGEDRSGIIQGEGKGGTAGRESTTGRLHKGRFCNDPESDVFSRA